MSDRNGLRYTATVEKRFKAPGPQPNGLQAAVDGLWCIDQTNAKVYKLDWSTGAVLHEFQTATEHSSGITLDDDGNVWISSTFQLEVVRIDPNTGEELGRFPDPGTGYNVYSGDRESSSHGIEWRDGLIYVAAPPTQRIHVMDAASWKEVRSFPVTGVRLHGIGWGKRGHLWVTDTTAGTLTAIDPETGRSYDAFRVAEPDEVHGMTVRNGEEFWYCDDATLDIGVLKRPGA